MNGDSMKVRFSIFLLGITAALSVCAASNQSKAMDALYQQMDTVRQSHDVKGLEALKSKVQVQFDRASAGRADTGCFDAAGMLHAMPINIELQWEAKNKEQAARHQSYWLELNQKYIKYSQQCAASKS